MFDYLRAGAFGELTDETNVTAFDRYSLRQRMLVDVSGCTLRSTVLGREAAAARAAHAAGIGYCLPMLSGASLEAVSTASRSQDLAFQLYMLRDRAQTRLVMDRAAQAGYSSLFLTVDVPFLSRRDCALGNGLMGGPSRWPLRAFASMAVHPRWLMRQLRGPRARWGNLAGLGRNVIAQSVAVARQLDPMVTWRDVEWLRRHWEGRLVLKGILTPVSLRRSGIVWKCCLTAESAEVATLPSRWVWGPTLVSLDAPICMGWRSGVLRGCGAGEPGEWPPAPPTRSGQQTSVAPPDPGDIHRATLAISFQSNLDLGEVRVRMANSSSLEEARGGRAACGGWCTDGALV